MKNIKKIILSLCLLPLPVMANVMSTDTACIESGNYIGELYTTFGPYSTMTNPIQAFITINNKAIHLHFEGNPFVKEYDLEGSLNFSNPNLFNLGGMNGVDLHGCCINHHLRIVGDLEGKAVDIDLHND